MLVLTRKVGDVIAIGDNIKIVVMSIRGKQVRLGIQADKDTVVHREEVYQKIKQETHSALKNDPLSVSSADAIFKGAALNTSEDSNDTEKRHSNDKLQKRSAVKVRKKQET